MRIRNLSLFIKLETLASACNLEFAFLQILIICSLKSNLLSSSGRESDGFSEQQPETGFQAY